VLGRPGGHAKIRAGWLAATADLQFSWSPNAGPHESCGHAESGSQTVGDDYKKWACTSAATAITAESHSLRVRAERMACRLDCSPQVWARGWTGGRCCSLAGTGRRRRAVADGSRLSYLASRCIWLTNFPDTATSMPSGYLVMSMQPRPWPDVPELTAKMARSSSRQGNLAMRIRDELGEVYADARFAAAFGVRGRPGISPGQLMMASVLQFSENPTGRQAAEAVRDRMTWKYALGLELDDPGFDASVLDEFRSRLVAGDLAYLALDALLERLAGSAWSRLAAGSAPIPLTCWARSGQRPGAG
jgi:transposase